MTMTSNAIITEINAHIENRPNGRWYVGITNDPKRRLFTEHEVSEADGIWIYRQADSLTSRARWSRRTWTQGTRVVLAAETTTRCTSTPTRSLRIPTRTPSGASRPNLRTRTWVQGPQSLTNHSPRTRTFSHDAALDARHPLDDAARAVQRPVRIEEEVATGCIVNCRGARVQCPHPGLADGHIDVPTRPRRVRHANSAHMLRLLVLHHYLLRQNSPLPSLDSVADPRVTCDIGEFAP